VKLILKKKTVQRIQVLSMKIDIVSAVPDIFGSFFSESILKRGSVKGLLEITVHDLRKWALDKHKVVDDTPYGGGPGMIMRVDVLHRAISELKSENSLVILTTPRGEKLAQSRVRQLVEHNHLIIVCGHYKAVDERFNQFVDLEISIGDFILTGGELPAAILTDAVCRLVPGVISDLESANTDSFENGLLDCGYYTRPLEYAGVSVPEVLVGGNHKLIKEFRQQEAERITESRRPDLYQEYLKNL